jgi:hypothetical protein
MGVDIHNSVVFFDPLELSKNQFAGRLSGFAKLDIGEGGTLPPSYYIDPYDHGSLAGVLSKANTFTKSPVVGDRRQIEAAPNAYPWFQSLVRELINATAHQYSARSMLSRDEYVQRLPFFWQRVLEYLPRLTAILRTAINTGSFSSAAIELLQLVLSDPILDDTTAAPYLLSFKKLLAIIHNNQQVLRYVPFGDDLLRLVTYSAPDIKTLAGTDVETLRIDDNVMRWLAAYSEPNDVSILNANEFFRADQNDIYGWHHKHWHGSIISVPPTFFLFFLERAWIDSLTTFFSSMGGAMMTGGVSARIFLPLQLANSAETFGWFAPSSDNDGLLLRDLQAHVTGTAGLLDTVQVGQRRLFSGVLGTSRQFLGRSQEFIVAKVTPHHDEADVAICGHRHFIEKRIIADPMSGELCTKDMAYRPYDIARKEHPYMYSTDKMTRQIVRSDKPDPNLTRQARDAAQLAQQRATLSLQ